MKLATTRGPLPITTHDPWKLPAPGISIASHTSLRSRVYRRFRWRRTSLRAPARFLPSLPPRASRWWRTSPRTHDHLTSLSRPCRFDLAASRDARRSGKSPVPPKNRDPPALIDPPAGVPEVCQICNTLGHFTAKCPQALCSRCQKRGHLSVLCTSFLPWEFVPAMCAFQSRGQGFYYMHDFCDDGKPKERSTNVILTVLEGFVTSKILEKEFEVYIGQGWRCSAHAIADRKYVMRFPNLREVDRALYVEKITLRSCGAVIGMSPWSDDLDAEALLEIAWVKIGRIPLEKRCDKNVAYVGGLVGITLEVDMATMKRPSFVRAKIGCRSVDKIPATAEGCLGDRFYRFTYEVDEVLVKNPFVEEEEVVIADDKKASPVQTPKRKRPDEEKKEKYQAYDCGNPGTSKNGGGKTCCLTQENEDPMDYYDSSDDDISLLIEQITRNQELAEQRNCEGWLVPTNTMLTSSAIQVPVGLVQLKVQEIEGEVDPELKVSSDYVVQLPSECNEEVIPTPPLVPEISLRFSRRKGVDLGMKIDQKAEMMAKKRDLEGLQNGQDMKKMKSGTQMIRDGSMMMMKLCDAAKKTVEGA